MCSLAVLGNCRLLLLTPWGLKFDPRSLLSLPFAWTVLIVLSLVPQNSTSVGIFAPLFWNPRIEMLGYNELTYARIQKPIAFNDFIASRTSDQQQQQFLLQHHFAASPNNKKKAGNKFRECKQIKTKARTWASNNVFIGVRNYSNGPRTFSNHCY